MPPTGPSSELTHAGRPYELTLLVSTVLVHRCKNVQKKITKNCGAVVVCSTQPWSVVTSHVTHEVRRLLFQRVLHVHGVSEITNVSLI